MDVYVAINSFLLLLSVAVNLGFAFYVYSRNPSSEVNRFFCYIFSASAFWSICFAVFLNIRSLELLLLVRRLTPVGSALIAGLVLYFSLVFPRPLVNMQKWWKYACVVPGFIFALLSVFTPFLIRSFFVTNPKYLFLGQPIFGPGYLAYTIYFFIYFFSGLGVLIYKYVNGKDREKLQIFYVFCGIAFAGLLGVILSLLLPQLGVSYLSSLGPFFTLITASFTAHAILRYKLLNIEDFLMRGILFLSISIALIGSMVFFAIGEARFIFDFLVLLSNLSLGLVVLLHNPKNKINLSFFLIACSLALWTIGVYLFWNNINVDYAFIGGKIAFLGASLIPNLLFWFCLIYPKEIKRINWLNRFLIAWPIIIFPVLVFNDRILTSVYWSNGQISRNYGPAYPLFVLYILCYLAFCFWELYKKEQILSGINKIQIRYVFMAFMLTAFFAATTNLIFPFIGIRNFSFLGPQATFFWIAIIAYAIIKHRLMSIEVVLQRSLAYAAVTVLILSFYATAVIISELFLRSLIGYSSLLISAAAALIIAIAFQPLVAFFQTFTFRHFFKGRYDYQKTLKELSQKIASVIKLDELTRLVINSFVDIMRLSEISFMLIDRERNIFRAVASNLPRYKYVEIDCQSPIVVWLTASKDILVKEEIEDEISRQKAMGEESLERVRSLEEINDVNTKLGISVWVPIISKEELIGIIALGNKLSGDVFSIEDIGLMSTMASQVAVALENSRLYNEVVNMKDYSEEILQSMVNGVMTVDKRGYIITFNAMAEKITGRKAIEVINKKPEEIWGKRGDIPRVIESSLADRCYINFETGIASQARGMVPVSLSSTILKDHDRKKNGVLVIITDMTEVKELEDKVRRADKLTALANMAAGMAHEIKNPLSSMKVLSQLLPLKFNDEQFRNKLMEIFPREINRIDRIVENLLSFARATAPNYEKLDLKAMLEESVNYFTPKALESEVKIETHYADLPQIEMDKTQMSQVFSNLMLNAIQAMPNGGTLKVETLPGKKRDDVLRSVVVRIWDTGHGISPENLKKLFDPFFTTKYGGTGLGLTITHSIIDGHKGYIDVESQVGKGTGFSVTLPITQGLV